MIVRVILDKERPIIFGMNALNLICEDFGVSMSGLGKLVGDITPLQFTKLIYYGLKDGARRDKIQFDLSVEDVADLLDDPEKAVKAFEVFIDQYSDGTEVEGKKVKGSS